ncbi:hypothetical protein IBX65_06005, partial [Candidatus Aerophobetes bacterium]|nr:hypothetical protein [Candidatus Aerophobetes bacterium]
MKLNYKIDAKLSFQAKLIGRMKLGTFLALPEKDFSEYIKKIEENELFQELINKYKIIKYRKFQAVKPISSHPQFREELAPAPDFDPVELIQKYPQNWQIVKKVALKMGEKKFSLFLKGNSSISLKEIFKECELSPEETEKFKDFINNFQLQESFFASDTSETSSPATHPYQVACIENQEGRLFILPADNSTYLSKGKYIIKHEQLKNLIQERFIPQDKAKKISSLLYKLDMINRRTITLYQILYQIKQKQHRFFLSADPKNIVPLTQLDMAKALRVNPSTISRAIANKSIITPWREEKSLIEFFRGKKGKIKIILRQIIIDEMKNLREGILKHPLNDEKIKEKLKDAFGVQVARRTVAKYREELKIPPSS